ncbi:uncharacterized protein LOC142546580 isoform X2 [Primulina tabacum]|uniref:uncharacterized protein LOC142546580 isoform X2 n=1 Tax=Primulina tabacum TaxID=48773 RepID=UPI003F59BB5B
MEVFVGCFTRFSVLFTTKISTKKKMVAYTACHNPSCMAFPHSHSPHSGWDKFHSLTKISTRAQLPLINIQRNYSSKLVGTLESKCSEPEDFYVVSSESTSLVTQNWGDIYGVPWLLLVLVCIGSIRDGNM